MPAGLDWDSWVGLAKISQKLGRSVHFDPQTERFVNDPEADKFLKREYRAPYVVPEQV